MERIYTLTDLARRTSEIVDRGMGWVWSATRIAKS